MRSNSSIRCRGFNRFSFLVCVFALSSMQGFGAATETKDGDHIPGGGPGTPAAVNRPKQTKQQTGNKITSPSSDFHRFQFPFMGTVGSNNGLGSCSVTFIDTKDMSIDLSSISGGSELCLGATASHCLGDVTRAIGDQVALGQDTSKSVCRGTSAVGIKANIEISFPGNLQRQALIIKSSNFSSTEDGVGLIAIPCPPSITKFKLNDDEKSELKQMQIAYPMSNKMKGSPLYLDAQRSDTIPAGTQTLSNGQTVTIQRSTIEANGKLLFNRGTTPIGGDSGSPGFIVKQGKKILAGVLSGEGIPGVSMVAPANFKNSVEKLLADVKCETPLISGPDDSEQVAQTNTPSSDQTIQRPGSFQEFNPGETPAQKRERQIASPNEPQPSDQSPLAQSPVQPIGGGATTGGGENCEGGSCTPKNVPQNGAGGPNPFQPPSFNPVPSGGTIGNSKANPEPSVQASQGFKEVQATDQASFEQALRQARKDGVKHIVVTYGSYERCDFCKDLRDDLQRKFGNEGDVRVIKMPEEYRPDPNRNIPQSELLTQLPDGKWKKSPSRVGSNGTAQAYKDQVDILRQRGPNPAQSQPQTPPQVSQSPDTKPEEKTAPVSGAAATVEKDRSNGGTGFQIVGADRKLGLRHERDKGPGKNIHLVAGADGKRYAATQYTRTDGKTGYSSLTRRENEALREYYLEKAEDLKKLPPEQQQYIKEFLASFPDSPKEVAEAKPEPKAEKIQISDRQLSDALGQAGVSEVGTLKEDKSKSESEYNSGGQHVFWMTDDLTGNSYRFVYDETSKKLVHKPLPGEKKAEYGEPKNAPKEAEPDREVKLGDLSKMTSTQLLTLRRQLDRIYFPGEAAQGIEQLNRVTEELRRRQIPNIQEAKRKALELEAIRLRARSRTSDL